MNENKVVKDIKEIMNEDQEVKDIKAIMNKNKEIEDIKAVIKIRYVDKDEIDVRKPSKTRIEVIQNTTPNA
ncbi:hypothetical protein M0802_015493 [Mischocyttarus mexicanus]|nr:hypothetical protein M0802_015493 [Mischocyttarus mexicanus]